MAEVHAGVVGILLAAGAGRRLGRPKAGVMIGGRSLVARAATTLLDGGCGCVVVVLGADASVAQALVPVDPRVQVVVAESWASGMSASLRAGLAAASDTPAEAALLHLVDLPDVSSAVVSRLASTGGPAALVRATYRSRPGHPVLVGRSRWPDLLAGLGGDTGARDYLAGQDVLSVPCEDLATGEDVDTAAALAGYADA